MYNPRTFRQTDLTEIRRFAAENPLATVVLATGQGPDAAHVPLDWQDDGSEYGCLRGHFARANPIWQSALPEQPWLVIFQHGGHYISPNWYPGKQQHHKAVPTWNYQAVHIRGRAQLVTDEAAVHALLAALTARHEAGQPRPWSLNDAPADYLAAQYRAIVCFDIRIEQIEAKYKLSQNQRPADVAGVIAGLDALGSAKARDMADRVRRFAPDHPENT